MSSPLIKDLLTTEPKRIEWIDVFRGIAILLVVIGHTNAPINKFIYLFHVGAFFFISGHASNLEKKSLLNVVVNRTYTLLLPYIVAVIVFILAAWGLDKLNLYHYLFTNTFGGIANSLNAFLNNMVPVEWLGATWFLVALFVTFVVQKIILLFSNNKISILYIILSYTVFNLGYYLIAIKWVSQGWYLDVVCIAQMYFAMGLVFKEYKVFEKVFSVKNFKYILLPILIIIFYILIQNKAYVDYPARTFSSAFLNFIAVIAGVFFLYIFSDLIVKGRILKSQFLLFGKNTLGILIFHFAAFKVPLFLLFLAGVIPFVNVSHFLLDNGNWYWWFVAIVAIYVSVGIWVLLNKSKVIRIFLGQYNPIKNKLKEIDQIMIRLFNKARKLFGSFSAHVKNHKKLYIAAVIGAIIILSLLPLLRFGITVNDELQVRYHRMLGIPDLFAFFYQTSITTGRLLGWIPRAVCLTVSFISNDFALTQVIKLAIIALDAIFFGVFIQKLFKKTALSLVSTILFAAFLPICFEHVMPMAFNGMYGIPIALFFISLILFISHLEKGKKSAFILSIVLYCFVITCYETFLLYLPIYYLIYYKINKEEFRFKPLFKKCQPYLLITLIYIILYFVMQSIFPPIYQGNTLGDFSFGGASNIIINLVLSALPGFYLMNPKYAYILTSQLMQGNNTNLPLALIEQSLQPRVIILCLFITCALIFTLFNMKKKPTKNIQEPCNKKRLIFILSLIYFAIMPTSLIAVASGYQGEVGQNGFIALPNTYFIYFAIIFIISYFIVLLFEKFRSKIFMVLLSVALVFSIFMVQGENDWIAQQQFLCIQKVEVIETFLSTDELNGSNINEIYAPSFYTSVHSLGIHTGYWTDYEKNILHKDIKIDNAYNGQSYYADVLKNKGLFVFAKINQIGIDSSISSNRIELLSKDSLDGLTFTAKDMVGNQVELTIKSGKLNNFMYVYDLKYNQNIKLDTIGIK